MFLLPLISSAQANSFLGLDLVPISRGDLVWLEEEQTSGTLVGEFDGIIQPSLSAYGGLQKENHAWIFGVGLAHLGSLEWTADGRRAYAQSAIKLGVDWQKSLGDNSETKLSTESRY